MRAENALTEHAGNHTGEITLGSVIGIVVGWIAKIWAGFALSTAPRWFEIVFQAVITVIVGCITVVTTHFLKRTLEREYPSKRRTKDPVLEEK